MWLEFYSEWKTFGATLKNSYAETWLANAPLERKGNIVRECHERPNPVELQGKRRS
ncbi:hypothetical protein [Neobacillus sp. PS3-40]|uniref:hypothetical protein n=1 Tax=Neobacillus sp. PS3-40 TaxID=3070679 RepID=UPI0027E1F8C6|nr:hypothetical protein [Neobacillus sp. PS3-40]WML44286.1 hypothetical protein RCG20_21370 [Neobacillus sp. PS3-40]